MTHTAPLPKTAALIVIDVQQGFDDPFWGPRNNPAAESNIAKALSAWRESGRPIFHVQHLSTKDGSPLVAGGAGVEFKEETKPLWHEPVVTKKVNSAFIGTDLEARLRARGINTIAICGLTTNHCVETSTRMAGNLGFLTFLIGDACATFDRTGPDGMTYTADQIHAISLASMHEEFATVVNTDEILAMLPFE